MGNSGSKPIKKGSKKSSNLETSPRNSKSIKSKSKIKSSSPTTSSDEDVLNKKDQLNSTPAATPEFTRSDTMQSTKSNKSLRSKRSKRSQSSIGRNTSNVDGDVEVNRSVSREQLNQHLKEIQRTYSSGSNQINHSRTHSLSRIPTTDSNKNYNVENNSNNNYLYASNNGSRLGSRKSSFNGSYDIPPSMIQGTPKSPILKNKNYTTSSMSSFHENALTDGDDDDEFEAHSNNNYPNSKNRVDILRPTHSSGHSRSSSFASRSKRKSNNGTNDNDSIQGTDQVQSTSMARTGSHNSLPSRRSSTNSVGTNSFVTPMNSPAIKNMNSIDGNDDYFTISNRDGDENDFYSNDGNGSSAYSSSTAEHSKRNSSFPKISIPFDEAELFFNEKLSNNDNMMKKKKPTKIVDIDETIQNLLDAGYAAKRTKNVCLKNSEISQICQRAREIFLSQPPLLELSAPVKIVGDVHGQYGDLLRLFTKCGFPPSSNYLFLGDYVDRGKQSLETILLLLCYKIKYPENFFLLRGNHECANVTRVYGFYDECKRRCNIKTWKVFVDTFNTLPLAAIVTGKIFCVHGGLSPVLNSMDEIRHVSRPTDIPDFGLINDLLWSDPTDSPNEWEDNERGVSYCYNKVAINKFLNKFGFDLVCRAHMVVEDGYEFFNDRSLVTVFSAPNYCGEFDNWGAVMSVSEGLLCSFELLDPLDSTALKQVMKKGRIERKLANQQQQQLVQN